MGERKLIIIGGGLAGLSAGCYGLRNGYRTTIIEHNLALGGVCTAWNRGPYTIDGCIHWLTGGPFQRVYEELEILPTVGCRTLETWLTYRDGRSGLEVPFVRDLDALVRQLSKLSPEDGPELQRLREGFYMAGQWVEPGGGVPTAVLSGRQAVQLLCNDAGRPFAATG